MTEDQEEHLNDIKNDFIVLVDKKYRKGQVDHGGNLFDFTPPQILDMAIDEAIDMFVYLISIKYILSGPKNEPKDADTDTA